MRSDASSLLTKLNQGTLTYRQFDDPLADLELWPVFEALLSDPRVVEVRRSRIEEREYEFQQARAHGTAGAAAAPSPTPQPAAPAAAAPAVSQLLSAYGSGSNAQDSAPAVEKNGGRTGLRDFLSRLGEDAK
jgi:hypothetical protein